MRTGSVIQAYVFGAFSLAPLTAHSQTSQGIIKETMSCVSVANCNSPDRCIGNVIYPTFKIRGDGDGYVLLGSNEPRPLKQFNNTSAANDVLSVQTDEQAFWLVVVPATVMAREDGAVQRDFHLYEVRQNALTDLKGLSSEFMQVSCSVVEGASNN
jgi:hypothetical protein